jgi:hypothetical protein
VLGLVTDTSISRCVRVRWTGKSQEKDEGQLGKRQDGRKDTDYNTYLSDTTHGVAVDFFCRCGPRANCGGSARDGGAVDMNEKGRPVGHRS